METLAKNRLRQRNLTEISKKNAKMNIVLNTNYGHLSVILNGTKHSRMAQVKFVEDSL